MRILLISDVPDKKYWDYYQEGMLKEFDLIISCGDLPPQYLSFLVTFSSCPLLYVKGNHDECYDRTPPDGCICVDDTIYTYKGIRILGLGGSMRYKDGSNQFTDKEMQKRIKKLKRQLKKNKGFDILLTHAPARGINDGEDLPHMGFDSFITLIETYKPKYFFHGHIHLNYGFKIPRTANYEETIVINGFKSYILDIDEAELQ